VECTQFEEFEGFDAEDNTCRLHMYVGEWVTDG